MRETSYAAVRGDVISSESPITVLIVNLNRCEELRCLLRDLAAQSRPADAIIVVDNGSTDGSPAMVASEFPAVQSICLGTNTGASHARNVGLAAALSDLVVILDNDLRIVDVDFLAKVAESAIRHADCAVISFEQVIVSWCRDEDRPAGVFTLEELKQLAASGRGPGSGRAFYYWLFWVGACAIRKSAWEQVGRFDAQFRYGGEEWDFAYRCLAADLRLLRDTGLWVIHAQSPRMRTKYNIGLLLAGMIIAQAIYFPLVDLVIFLSLQFLKSMADAVRQWDPAPVLYGWWKVAGAWRTQVLPKRTPLPRRVMNRVYYLRTHSPATYAEVEAARSSVWRFYLARARRRTPEQQYRAVVVAMMPATDATHSAVESSAFRGDDK
jgi:GT2 family glycosyltransferase